MTAPKLPTAEQALKPCPFCSGSAALVTEGYEAFEKESWAECDDCGARSSRHFVTSELQAKEDVTADWNRRAQAEPAAPGEVAGLVERLRASWPGIFCDDECCGYSYGGEDRRGAHWKTHAAGAYPLACPRCAARVLFDALSSAPSPPVEMAVREAGVNVEGLVAALQAGFSFHSYAGATAEAIVRDYVARQPQPASKEK